MTIYSWDPLWMKLRSGMRSQKPLRFWLMPSAASILPKGRRDPRFFTWNVPLGEAGYLRTKVLNPLMLALEQHPNWTGRDDWPDFTEAARAQMDHFLRRSTRVSALVASTSQ
jgi:hypothetical protein